WKRFIDWVIAAKVPVFAGATAAILLVVAGITRGPALRDWLEIQGEKRRVAEAYAEKRMIEPRLTGVKYGAYQQPSVTLSQEDPADNLNRPLLNEAYSELSRKATSRVDLGQQWLQIQGRLTLLKDPRNAQIAEEVFHQAQAKAAGNRSLEIDLAVSSF